MTDSPDTLNQKLKQFLYLPEKNSFEKINFHYEIEISKIPFIFPQKQRLQHTLVKYFLEKEILPHFILKNLRKKIFLQKQKF